MTAAVDHGFDTRATLGLRSPKSVSTNIAPDRGGVALHWIGGASRLTGSSPHADCQSLWRRIQIQHMDGNGWADVAYTMAVCPHGRRLAGRGSGVRTAAQGTNDGNQRFYAICRLLGLGEKPTKQMDEATAYAVWLLRHEGRAGREVRPHSHFRPTQCPGPEGTTLAAGLHNRDITVGSSDAPPPPPEEDTMFCKHGDGPKDPKVEALQEQLNRIFGETLKVDGHYGDLTGAALSRAIGNNNPTSTFGPTAYARLEAAKTALGGSGGGGDLTRAQADALYVPKEAEVTATFR